MKISKFTLIHLAKSISGDEDEFPYLTGVNSCEVDPSSWDIDPLAEMASSGHCQNGIL